MKSKIPKALHKIGGKPMIGMVRDAAVKAGVGRIVVVVGFGAEHIKNYLGDSVEYAHQREQLGTGHALLTGLDYLYETANSGGAFGDRVLALYGDMPLVSAESLKSLIERNRENGEHGTTVYADLADSYGFGRIVRDAGGGLLKIVEQKDATPEEALITEYNVGVYCFEAEAARAALGRLRIDNAQGEMYLTDVFAELIAAGRRVGLHEIADPSECLGANDRAGLAEINRVVRMKKCMELMLESGVTIVDPASTYIDQDVAIGMDTTIFPGCFLESGTVIGENCEIGPGAKIRNTRIGDGVHVQYSVLTDATVGDNVSIGPYAQLRPGAAIGSRTKIGDFVEIKNANIGEKVSISHLAYIGDADVGSNVNIGCGVITCNYDGKLKYRTTIGKNSFIGSNTNLIAPVTVADNAYVASGSTITDDVPEDALAIARSRQVNKEHWVSRKGFRRD
ncbi:MAG: bifunctional UDP-N-acetylglucosamine diphosphorylase/glucosamine-1-phosphate N-acetyltransferase GlmU [Oscillospiraceae bacterium]|nr:bifunctional UDP-N-acetylglucosamine diphosphorylase/glucosamine-1-phosphate N-acetyltransferase GlmU [Oscillospiraceae bacterium]